MCSCLESYFVLGKPERNTKIFLKKQIRESNFEFTIFKFCLFLKISLIIYMGNMKGLH